MRLELNIQIVAINSNTMKKLLFTFLVCISQTSFSQNDTLYLIVEKPNFGSSCERNLSFGFAIKSIDKRFSTDYYYFEMQNGKGLTSQGDFEYYDREHFGIEVDIDSIKYESVQKFTEKKDFWQIHNELSLKKKIFLLEKRQGDFNTVTGHYNQRYYILPMIYEGTRKNIVPTDF